MRTCTKAKRSFGKRLAFESLESRRLLSTTNAKSEIWAGYAIKASGVTMVSGTWNVPTVATTPSGAYMSAWVGIDGYGNSTVEQIGTLAKVANGKVTYSAWYEMYPANAVTITSLTISAGDTITGSVTYYSSGTHAKQFLLKLTDSTTGKSFSTYQSSSSAKRATAEWVIERPAVNGTHTSLANFSTEMFWNCKATIAGTTSALGSWSNYKINMVSSGTTLASTGSLSTSGGASKFTISFKASKATSIATIDIDDDTAPISTSPIDIVIDPSSTDPNDSVALANTVTDTVSVGLTNTAVSNVWNQALANFKLTDLTKEADNFDLLAKKTLDTASTDSVFASFGAGSALVL